MKTESKLLKENYRGYTIYAYGELADDKNNFTVKNEQGDHAEVIYGRKFSCSAVVAGPLDNFTEADAIKACKRRFKEQTIMSANSSFLRMPLAKSILSYLIEYEKKFIDKYSAEKYEDNTQTCECGAKVCHCQEKDNANNVSGHDFRDKYARIEFNDGSWAIGYNCQKNDNSNVWDADWVKWLSDDSVLTRSPYLFYNNQITEIREATEDEVNCMKDVECKMLEETKKLKEASKNMFDVTDKLSLFPFWGW